MYCYLRGKKGRGGVKIKRWGGGGWESKIFAKFNKLGGQNKLGGVGISKETSISVINQKRDIKVSKQTRSEVSKNKVIIN